MKIEIPNKTEIRSIVINELIRRDKLISKAQLNEFIDKQSTKKLEFVYKEIDKLRRKINELESTKKNINKI